MTEILFFLAGIGCLVIPLLVLLAVGLCVTFSRGDESEYG